MDIELLHPVIRTVKPDETCRFYRMLDFVVIEEGMNVFYLAHQRNPDLQIIIRVDEADHGPPLPTGSGIRFELQDVDAAYAILKDLGMPFHHDLADKPDAPSGFTLLDPNGVLIEFSSLAGN